MSTRTHVLFIKQTTLLSEILIILALWLSELIVGDGSCYINLQARKKRRNSECGILVFGMSRKFTGLAERRAPSHPALMS
jgi:hypothetical protein